MGSHLEACFWKCYPKFPFARIPIFMARCLFSTLRLRVLFSQEIVPHFVYLLNPFLSVFPCKKAKSCFSKSFCRLARRWPRFPFARIPICSKMYCKASQFGLPSPTILKTKVLKGETEHSQVWEKKNELTETWHCELVGVREKDKPTSTDWLVRICETMQQNSFECSMFSGFECFVLRKVPHTLVRPTYPRSPHIPSPHTLAWPPAWAGEGFSRKNEKTHIPSHEISKSDIDYSLAMSWDLKLID